MLHGCRTLAVSIEIGEASPHSLTPPSSEAGQSQSEPPDWRIHDMIQGGRDLSFNIVEACPLV